ncbi:cytochrome P450 [Pseudonocardia aurantiaca]|uniref:Cytochrome P450 n=1 Tax=Pseudonocardia aurantiaca TaxID=75290 RepID=A0ABW4FWZ6_9PSEU
MTNTTDQALVDTPDYPMPRAAGCPFDPPPALRALQAQAPITRVRLWDGSTPWLVTRYADQRALLADPRISSDTTAPGYPHISAGVRERRTQARTFISMDDPEHARLRRMVTATFAIKRVEALRPAIQRIVDDLIDQMLAGPTPVDLVQAFALPVPSLVICHLLGVPYADHDFFQRNSKLLINRDTPPEVSRQAQATLTDYLDRLITDKLAHPADDLLSRLAHEQVRTGELTQRELAVVASLLLVAGHETTANMIALGTLALLQHPDQLAALRATTDPALIRSTVEELLRYLTIVHSGRRRVALADIEIDDQLIHAGDGVILATEVGNRDEQAFADPDALDLHRDARAHVAFGFGVHQCLGQPLARVELQVVYGTLYRRIPTLRLVGDVADIPFKHDGAVYGVYELPVTWSTTHLSETA